MPVTRPVGRALLVGSATARSGASKTLSQLGYEVVERDDPYSAMVELCRRRLAFASIILCLQSIYREELAMILTLKRRFPHVEIWLAQTDGRAAFLAEALRIGADGLLTDDGLHRVAAGGFSDAASRANSAAQAQTASGNSIQNDQPAELSADASVDQRTDGSQDSQDSLAAEVNPNEPVLTADELRALLDDQPSLPPAGEPEGR